MRFCTDEGYYFMFMYLLSSLIRIEFADLLLLFSARAPFRPRETSEFELAPLLLNTVCLAFDEWPTELF